MQSQICIERAREREIVPINQSITSFTDNPMLAFNRGTSSLSLIIFAGQVQQTLFLLNIVDNKGSVGPMVVFKIIS